MKRWKEKDLKKLRRIYPDRTTREVAEILRKPYSHVKSQASNLGLLKSPGFNRMAYKMHPEKIRAFVRQNYTMHTNHQLAKLAGISESSIHDIRKEAGLTKANSGTFPKGNRPWNFRTKGLGLYKSPPGMKRTQFKKGQLPGNTLHDGAITTRLDHPKDRKGRPYKWIRISVGKWIHYHRWKWMQKNGPVPAKHMVVFRDGDTMNCSLRNLELITMADNAIRNASGDKGRSARELTDNYIAGKIVGRGNKKLRKAFIQANPGLIHLKRTQLLLNREIKNDKHHQVAKAA